MFDCLVWYFWHLTFDYHNASTDKLDIIQEPENSIWSVAVSNNDLRVAVGWNNNGNIDIYIYNCEDLKDSLTHPFLSNKKKSKIGTDNSQVLTHVMFRKTSSPKTRTIIPITPSTSKWRPCTHSIYIIQFTVQSQVLLSFSCNISPTWI